MDYLDHILPEKQELPPMVDFVNIPTLRKQIFEAGLSPYILVNLTGAPIRFYDGGIERMVSAASDCDAAITFAWFKETEKDGNRRNHPLIDYQFGSVRDNFDFGSVVLLATNDVIMATESMDIDLDNFDFAEYPDGGWYALRLRIGTVRPVCLVSEYLYEADRTEYRDSGQRQHDYVAISQRQYQKAMEKIFLDHLEALDALIKRENLTEIDYSRISSNQFPVEASVIIPVRNRCKTIADAVKSALTQQTDFRYNVIVVDNGSTDGTSQILDSITADNLIVIHTDDSEGLGIGGCWNRAVNSEFCGKFACQLDSDDMYQNTSTLQKIVDCFYGNRCGMVVGSYSLTDINLTPLTNQIIDHREWTDENGMNNALRINGFGAPRAFFTPIVRHIPFPNVSYGEDYAVALRVSGLYKVGRIYESIYCCRRWEGNSDAGLTIEKENEHNYYKDFVRTLELLRRARDAKNMLPF